MGAGESTCFWCALPAPGLTATSRVVTTARAVIEASCSPAVIASSSAASAVTYVAAPCDLSTKNSANLDVQCVTSAVWAAVAEELNADAAAFAGAVETGGTMPLLPFCGTQISLTEGDVRERARDALVHACSTAHGANLILSSTPLDASGLNCEDYTFLAQRTGIRALCAVVAMQTALATIAGEDPSAAAALPPRTTPMTAGMDLASFLAVAIYIAIAAIIAIGAIAIVYSAREASELGRLSGTGVSTRVLRRV